MLLVNVAQSHVARVHQDYGRLGIGVLPFHQCVDQSGTSVCGLLVVSFVFPHKLFIKKYILFLFYKNR
jgi:hypothetical protein